MSHCLVRRDRARAQVGSRRRTPGPRASCAHEMDGGLTSVVGFLGGAAPLRDTFLPCHLCEPPSSFKGSRASHLLRCVFLGFTSSSCVSHRPSRPPCSRGHLSSTISYCLSVIDPWDEGNIGEARRLLRGVQSLGVNEGGPGPGGGSCHFEGTKLRTRAFEAAGGQGGGRWWASLSWGAQEPGNGTRITPCAWTWLRKFC